MNILDRLLKPALKKIIVNRWNYIEEEYKKAAKIGFFDVFNLNTLRYWIKAEPVCSNHCSGCHNEGKPLFFNALGLLIKHKCPSFICHSWFISDFSYYFIFCRENLLKI